MKRWMAILLAAAMLLTLLPAAALAAVGSTDTYCSRALDGQHDWGDWTITRQATCTQAGSRARICDRCSYTQTETIPKSSHSWGNWKTTVEATCTSQGQQTRKCSVCGGTETRRTDKLAHTWGEWTVITEPTDHSAGTRTRTCKVCGTESTREFDPEGTLRRGDSGDAVRKLQEGLICYGVLTGKADGSFGPATEAAVKAAQEAEGLTADGVAWPQTQARLGHRFGEWETVQEMTDFSTGIRQHVCGRCGFTETEETWPEPTYKRGDKGDGVKDLQEKLNAAGYDCGKADGIFGKKTEAAVQALETANGFTADGIAWPGVQAWLASGVQAIPNCENGDSANDFLNQFRNTGISLRNLDIPLVIVTQPVGGKLPADGSGTVLLTVEAAGGKPPYTYQWREEFFGVYVPIPGATEVAYPATKVGNYTCRVTDNALDYVDSEPAEVYCELFIAEQPVNTNLHGRASVRLDCIAAGGVPFTGGELGAGMYSYAWYDAAGTQIKLSQEPFVDIDAVGEYYCVVEDAEGEQEKSLPAVVYDADPLTIEGVPESTYLRMGEEYVLSGRVTGGIEPYTVTWLRGEEALPTTRSEDGYYTTPIVCDGGEAVAYTLHVSDIMQVEADATETVYYKQLAIAKQPQSGMMSKEGAYTLDLEMAEGKAPFTFTLYRDDAPEAEWQSDELAQTWEAQQSGLYRFHIVDAAGDWADSWIAAVAEYSFHIDHIDVEGSIVRAGDRATLTAVTEGGTEPVRYSWWQQTENAKGIIVAEMCVQEGVAPVLATAAPGPYRCFVRDAEGRCDVMSARVPYLGSGPIVVRQPESVSFKYDKNELYDATMTCEAFADGGHELKYEWERKGMNGWKLFYTGSTMKYGEKETEHHRYYISGGVFRCKVTDTVTGQTTYSDEATITMPKLTVTGKQEGKSTTIKLHIEGGAGPYTVTCVRWRHAFDHFYNFVIEDYDLPDYVKQVYGAHSADITLTGVSKHAKKYIWDQFGYYYRHWIYVFTVTDTDGNTAKVTFRMHSDNIDYAWNGSEFLSAPDSPPGYDPVW